MSDKGEPRTLRVEILKPVERLRKQGARLVNFEEECTWSNLGKELRVYRRAMHRLFNDAIFNLATEVETGKLGEVFELDTNAKTASGRAYAFVAKAATDVREDWGENYTDFQPSGSCMSALSQEVFQSYTKWRTPPPKGDGRNSRLPTRKLGAPIPVPQAQLSLRNNNGKVWFTFKFTSGGSWTVQLAASKGTHWSKLRSIVSGEFPCGAAKVVYVERDRKWYMLLSYFEPAAKPTELDPNNVLFIHRGARNFVTAISSSGNYKRVAAGSKYQHQQGAITSREYKTKRDSLKVRQRSIRSISAAERGNGAKGHGRKRRYATHDALSDKLNRINQTLCQQVAAEVVRLCHQWGCGTVVIEEYGGIGPNEDRNVRRFVERFPLHMLKGAIAWSLKKVGIPLEELVPSYLHDCPRGGEAHEGTRDVRTNVFHCKTEGCGMERCADFVAAFNMMRLSGVSYPEWERKLRIEADLATGAESARAGAEQELDDEKGGKTSPSKDPKKTRKRTSRKAPGKSAKVQAPT